MKNPDYSFLKTLGKAAWGILHGLVGVIGPGVLVGILTKTSDPQVIGPILGDYPWLIPVFTGLSVAALNWFKNK